MNKIEPKPRVPGRPFASLATEDLLRLMRGCADQCVRVVNMTEEEKDRIGPKGEASPRQAGILSAVAVVQYARELELRGVDTGVKDLV